MKTGEKEVIDTLKAVAKQYCIHVEQLPDFVAQQSPMAYCAEKNVIGIQGINPSNEEDVFGFLHECGHHIDSLVHPVCYSVDKPYLFLSPLPPNTFEVLKGELRAWGFAWQLFTKWFPQDADEETKDRFYDNALWCIKTHYAHLCVVSFSKLLSKIVDKEKDKDKGKDNVSILNTFQSLLADRGKQKFENELPSILSTILDNEKFKDLQEDWQSLSMKTKQQRYRIEKVAKNALSYLRGE